MAMSKFGLMGAIAVLTLGSFALLPGCAADVSDSASTPETTEAEGPEDAELLDETADLEIREPGSCCYARCDGGYHYWFRLAYVRPGFCEASARRFCSRHEWGFMRARWGAC